MNATEAEDALGKLVLDDPSLMEALRAMGKVEPEGDARNYIWQRIRRALDARKPGGDGRSQEGR
jgi:hypothetical protein